MAVGLVMLGGTALLAVVTVSPQQPGVPETWLRDPAYHREVRRKRLLMAVVGLAVIGAGVAACP